jgi:hypothetical protein
MNEDKKFFFLIGTGSRVNKHPAPLLGPMHKTFYGRNLQKVRVFVFGSPFGVV